MYPRFSFVFRSLLLLCGFTFSIYASLPAQSRGGARKSTHKIYESEDFELYRKTETPDRFIRNEKGDIIAAPHVIPSHFTYTLKRKKNGKIHGTWEFESTGSGVIPLRIFQNGDVCYSRYGSLGMMPWGEKHPFVPMMAKPKDLVPIIAGEAGVFMQKRSSSPPAPIFFYTWKAIEKGRWQARTRVTNAPGASQMSSAAHRGGVVVFREGVFISRHQHYITFFKLPDQGPLTIDLRDHLPEMSNSWVSLQHFHADELVFRYSNKNYGYHLKKKKAYLLNPNIEPDDDGVVPYLSPDPDLPKHLHLVIHHQQGVLLQNRGGVLYYCPRHKKSDKIDYSSPLQVSDAKGIKKEEVGRYLTNVAWKEDQVVSLRKGTLMVYDLKNQALQSYQVPALNAAERFGLVNIHAGQVLFTTEQGTFCFETETGRCFNAAMQE